MNVTVEFQLMYEDVHVELASHNNADHCLLVQLDSFSNNVDDVVVADIPAMVEYHAVNMDRLLIFAL